MTYFYLQWETEQFLLTMFLRMHICIIIIWRNSGIYFVICTDSRNHIGVLNARNNLFTTKSPDLENSANSRPITCLYSLNKEFAFTTLEMIYQQSTKQANQKSRKDAMKLIKQIAMVSLYQVTKKHFISSLLVGW